MQSLNVMRKRTVFALSLLVVGGFAPGTVGTAQQAAPAPPAVSKPSTQDVMLPVTVRDKKGALVTDLQKNDLTLSQDGRPQIIKSFSRESTQPIRVGLLVDTSKGVSGALNEERKAVTQLLDSLLPATGSTKDQVFLIHFDREVELLEDFTGSREKIGREIDDMGPTKQERYDNQGPETTGDDRPSNRHGHNGTQLYDAIYLAADELMKNKDGRKLLVLFSNGADRGSKETLNDAIDAADRAILRSTRSSSKASRTGLTTREAVPGATLEWAEAGRAAVVAR